MRGGLVAVAAALFGCSADVELSLPATTAADQTMILGIENLDGRPELAYAFDLTSEREPHFAFRTDSNARLSLGVFQEHVSELRISAGPLSLQVDGNALPASGTYRQAEVTDGAFVEWRAADGALHTLTRVQTPNPPKSCFVLGALDDRPSIPSERGLTVPAIIDENTTLLVNHFDGVFEVHRDGRSEQIYGPDDGPAHGHLWSNDPSVFWTTDQTLRVSRIERNAETGTYDWHDVVPAATASVASLLEMDGGTHEGGTDLFVLTSDLKLLWTSDQSRAWLARAFEGEVPLLNVAWIAPRRAIVAPNTHDAFTADIIMASDGSSTITVDRLAIVPERTVSHFITAATYDEHYGAMAAGSGGIVVFYHHEQDKLVSIAGGRLFQRVRQFIRIGPTDYLYLSALSALNIEQDDVGCDTSIGVSREEVRFLRRVPGRNEALVVAQPSEGHPATIYYFEWTRVE